MQLHTMREGILLFCCWMLERTHCCALIMERLLETLQSWLKHVGSLRNSARYMSFLCLFVLLLTRKKMMLDALKDAEAKWKAKPKQ